MSVLNSFKVIKWFFIFLPFSHNYLAIAILCDFNIDIISSVSSPSHANVQRFFTASDTLNLHQLVVDFVTRPNSSGNLGSVFDLVFTNRPDLFTNIQRGLRSSDHNGRPISCNILTSYDFKSITRYIYQYNKANLNPLCDTLYRTNFIDLLFAVAKDVVLIYEGKMVKNVTLGSLMKLLPSAERNIEHSMQLEEILQTTICGLNTNQFVIRLNTSLLNIMQTSLRTYLRTAHLLQNVSGHLLTVSVVREVIIASV